MFFRGLNFIRPKNLHKFPLHRNFLLILLATQLNLHKQLIKRSSDKDMRPMSHEQDYGFGLSIIHPISWAIDLDIWHSIFILIILESI